MSEDRVSITITDGIADVRMTRADKRNALDGAMFEALAAAGERLDPILDRGRFLADHGVSAVQLRAKHHSPESVRALARRLIELVPLLIINDHVDIAQELGAWARVAIARVERDRHLASSERSLERGAVGEPHHDPGNGR